MAQNQGSLFDVLGRKALGQRSQIILDEILQNGPGSARNLKKRLKCEDLNEIRPRLTEMEKDGCLFVRCRIMDSKTGKLVNVYDAAAGVTNG